MSENRSSTTSATILYFDKGNPFFLKYSIAQTVEVCKTCRVVLLGDESNRSLQLCEWYPFASYFKSASHFCSIYEHLSTNDKEFDLLCFQTWFAFDEFVNKERIDGPIVCVDHDVLFYKDISLLFEQSKFEIATTSAVGNQYTFFRSPDLLHGYIAFMEKMYSIPCLYEKLEKIYRTQESPLPLPGGWICDMTLLGMYALQFGNRRLELSEPKGSSIYDYSIGLAEGFQYNPYKRIKRLHRDGKGFYGFRNGRRLDFAALHFQVGAKVFLPHYYTASRRFQDHLSHEYCRWRGRATTAVKWFLHHLKLFVP